MSRRSNGVHGRNYVLHLANGSLTRCGRLTANVNCSGDETRGEEICRTCRQGELKATHTATISMGGRLLGQLGWLFSREADALHDAYAWPPKNPTEEDRVEALRLQDASADIMTLATLAGQRGLGTDYVFGVEPDGTEPA